MQKAYLSLLHIYWLYFMLFSDIMDCLKFLWNISISRLVLSAVSDYFAAMFTNDVLEAKQEEVKMEGIDPNALNSLVQYAYTGKWLVCINSFNPHSISTSYNSHYY